MTDTPALKPGESRSAARPEKQQVPAPREVVERVLEQAQSAGIHGRKLDEFCVEIIDALMERHGVRHYLGDRAHLNWLAYLDRCREHCREHWDDSDELLFALP